MKVYKARKIARALVSKGFEEKRNAHHVQYFLVINGKRTSVHTYLSHNNQEYQRRTLSAVRGQLELEADEFDRLVECPLSHEEYVKLLVKRKRVVL